MSGTRSAAHPGANFGQTPAEIASVAVSNVYCSLLLLHAAKDFCSFDLMFQHLPCCRNYTLRLHMMQVSPALQAQHVACNVQCVGLKFDKQDLLIADRAVKFLD